MIEVTRRIDAPAQAVWAVLERIEDHGMKDAIAIRFEGQQRRGVGTRIVVDTRVGPLRTVDKMEFVSREPGVAMGVEHRGLIGGSGEFTLTTDGSATTVTRSSSSLGTLRDDSEPPSADQSCAAYGAATSRDWPTAVASAPRTSGHASQ